MRKVCSHERVELYQVRTFTREQRVDIKGTCASYSPSPFTPQIHIPVRLDGSTGDGGRDADSGGVQTSYICSELVVDPLKREDP